MPTMMVTIWRRLQADAGELDLAAKLGQEVDALRPRADERIRVFCRKKLTANEEIRSVAGSALRSGRKAARSVTSASTTAAAMPPTIMIGTGWPKSASSA